MKYSHTDLESRGVRIAEARNLTKAEVWLVKDADPPVIVKTLATRPLLARLLLGGFLLRREGRVLARLAGTPGVPRLLEADGASLVVEWKPGKTLFDTRKRGMRPEVAQKIERLLADFHATGFGHGDIGRRDILVEKNGAVTLLDFATAVGPGAPPLLGSLLAPLVQRRDRRRVAKMIRRYRKRWDKRAVIRAARRAAGRGPSRGEGAS